MSLTDMVIMPGADYQAACDAIREKTEGVGYIRSGDMAELIRSIETGNGDVQYFTLPKGRMRGDVNGDGLITSEDAELVLNISSELVTPTEVQRWCADVNADGRIDSTDKVMIDWLLMASPSSALTATPTMADYYGNWTWEKVDDASGYFYCDIPVDGVTEQDTITLLVSVSPEGYLDPVCMDGVVRVRARNCPVEETNCLIIMDGTDWTSVAVPSAEKPTYDVSVMKVKKMDAMYYSRNYPEGKELTGLLQFGDKLYEDDLYAILYDHSMTSWDDAEVYPDPLIWANGVTNIQTPEWWPLTDAAIIVGRVGTGASIRLLVYG